MSLKTLPSLEQPLIYVEDGINSDYQQIAPEAVSDNNKIYHHLASIALHSESNDSVKTRLSVMQGIAMLDTGEYLKASNGKNYGHLFGRDVIHSNNFLLSALQVAESDSREHSALSSLFCPVIEQDIVSLVTHMGTKPALLDGRRRKDGQAEGKIIHEVIKKADLPVGLAEDLQDSDETGSEEVVTFYSVDSTPLFVHNVEEYDKYVRKLKSPEAADAFLNKHIAHRNIEEEFTIGKAVLMSTDWIISELHNSSLGFVEYEHQGKSLHNQAMKDSLTAYVHKSGELANVNAPIASIEVQAMAYDALMDAADMFERAHTVAIKLGISNEMISNWRQDAKELRERIIGHFWIADEQRFAQAIDRDPNTSMPRRVETPTSNELELLDSRLLHDVEDAEKQKQYVSSLARQAMSSEFLIKGPGGGILSRARSQHQLVKFWDYHGSGTTWPPNSHRIANGLLKWGLMRAAERIDNSVLNSNNIGIGRNEYYLVDPYTGRVFYRYISKQQADEQGINDGILIVSTNIPEERQAWSESASMDIKAKIGAGVYKKVNSDCPEWATELDKEIMIGVDEVSVIKRLDIIEYLRNESPLAIVDVDAGKDADKRYLQLANVA